jgi:hypothetical protein
MPSPTSKVLDKANSFHGPYYYAIWRDKEKWKVEKNIQ